MRERANERMPDVVTWRTHDRANVSKYASSFPSLRLSGSPSLHPSLSPSLPLSVLPSLRLRLLFLLFRIDQLTILFEIEELGGHGAG